MTYKKFFYPILLVSLFVLLILLVLPDGRIYGSYTDWLSQHVPLGETIRSACIQQKTLAPAFLPLGGGSNGYQFSYYGYLRPDILIGCLFPDIPMVYFIIGYAVTGYLCSVLLCYYWLCEHTKDQFVSFVSSVFFLTAACFFHTHRQIMFVNYMPFLMLALFCVKKKWFQLLPFCMVLIYLNSFYYSIACLTVIGWYWMGQERGVFWKMGLIRYIKSVLLSIGMASLLLIPTAAVILEHRRIGGDSSIASIIENSLNPSSLLYSPYGMGLTALALYMLVLGVSLKQYRADCILLLCISFCGLAAWLLNGTLYARAKILIPFVPLIILVCTKLLLELKAQTLAWKLWPCLFLIPVLISKWGQRDFYWIATDICILFLVVWGQKRGWFDCRKSASYYVSQLLLCLMPCFLFYHTSQNENYVKTVDMLSEKLTVSASSYDEIGSLYRYENLSDVLNTGNLSEVTNLQKSGMYSSIYNKEYSDFYYDTLLSPVQINNRLAILPSSNPFLLNFLGVRYLQTSPDYVPDGYDIVGAASISGSNTMAPDEVPVLAENKQALPIAYVTGSIMEESRFMTMNRYDKLDAITRYTIVPDENFPQDRRVAALSGFHINLPAFHSEMKDFMPSFNNFILPDSIQLTNSANGWRLNVKNDSKLTLSFSEPIYNKLLLLEFQVVNEEKQAVVIDINNVRNKLSGKSAAYPNGNSTFHYQFSEDGLNTLQISLSKGAYTLKNIQWHTYDKNWLTEKHYSPVQNKVPDEQDILACRVTSGAQDYFVTSIPFQKGLEIFVDGETVPVLKLNQAFSGAALPSGTHDINIRFHAPGQKLGFILTCICWAIYLAGCLYRGVVKRFATGIFLQIL